MLVFFFPLSLYKINPEQKKNRIFKRKTTVDSKFIVLRIMEQKNLCETLDLNCSNTEFFKDSFNLRNLKESKKDTRCHEYIDDFVPEKVSSPSTSERELKFQESHCSDGDSYETPPVHSSEYGVDLVLKDSNSNNLHIGLESISNKKNNHITKGRPSSCIFVASLAAMLTDDQLCHSVTEKFQSFGKLNGVKVLRDPQNRPYAFVQYTNDHDAQRALNLSQGSTLNDRVIRCEQARVNRTLFISCSSPISCRDIVSFCEQFGELEQLIPSFTPDSNQSNKNQSNLLPSFKVVEPESYKSSCWFVQFAFRDDAIRAFANIKSELSWTVHWVQNVKVPRKYNLLLSIQKSLSEEFDNKHGIYRESCGSFINNKISIDRKSIFVGQLHEDTTTELLTKHFEIYGKIFNLKLIHKPTNIFAFIEYDEESSAAIALEKENHSTFLGKTIHVQYKEINHSFPYTKREVRVNQEEFLNGKFNNNNNSNKVFVSPQVMLAPPPINIARKKYLDNSAIEFQSDHYLLAPFKGYSNYRRNSYPFQWHLHSIGNEFKNFDTSDYSSKDMHVKMVNKNLEKGEEKQTTGKDISEGPSSDTVNSDYDTIGLIESPTHISMTSYNESSRDSFKPAKKNNMDNKSNYNYTGKSYYNSSRRRYSHPPNPYYQPGYFMTSNPYHSTSPGNSPSYMMYCPPIPMPPPELSSQHHCFQFNHPVSPYGSSLIPMMMPQIPPPPLPYLPVKSQTSASSTSNENISQNDERILSDKGNCRNRSESPHVSFKEDINPVGSFRKSVTCLNDLDCNRNVRHVDDKNNRFRKILLNKVPSFKPKMSKERKSTPFNEGMPQGFLDY